MFKIEKGLNNQMLRDIAEKVKTREMKSIVKLGNEMIKYIKTPKNRGCGLAAPQVGHSKRIIAVSLLKDWDDENYPTMMMINPEILDHSQDKDIDVEGCLSVPGEKGNVARWHEIKLTYTDEKSNKKTLYLEGLPSRIVQHEIDHLDGVLFVDKLVGM